jgi:hypothetical protein
MADDQASKHLEEARHLSNELMRSLATLVYEADYTLKSRIPFKAASVRELLAHRMHDLAKSAVSDLDMHAVVPGATLTRAAVETVAVLYCLNQEMVSFLATQDAARINSFLMSSLTGSRDSDAPARSVNVLTLIDKVAKELPGFRHSYDNLSEYTHPNWSGLLGSYGTVDREQHILHLGIRDPTYGMRATTHALAGALHTFKHFYVQSGENLARFNGHFEQA